MLGERVPGEINHRHQKCPLSCHVLTRPTRSELVLKKLYERLARTISTGEVIVADNGSTDGSQAIATRMGARVVNVAARGYGNALMGGIAAARGKYIIMGDADDSYDFLEIPSSSRSSGRATIWCRAAGCPRRRAASCPEPCRFCIAGGAIPCSPSWPALWFRAPIHDVYCGMRGFTRNCMHRLDQRCTGMEFATEMIIKSSLCRATNRRSADHPSSGRSQVASRRISRPFATAGARCVSFLMYSPRWLFFFPGCS